MTDRTWDCSVPPGGRPWHLGNHRRCPGRGKVSQVAENRGPHCRMVEMREWNIMALEINKNMSLIRRRMRFVLSRKRGVLFRKLLRRF